MKLKFLAGEPEPIYSHSALHRIINSIRTTYMRTVGRLGLTRIRTDISDKWILRTRQLGDESRWSISANEMSPLISPHLKRSRRGSIRSSTRTNDDSRGNVAIEFYRAVRTHDESGTFERTKSCSSYLSLACEGTTIGFTVSKIANDEIPPYQRTATLFSDLKHISCSSSSAAKLFAHSSRHKHDIVHRLKFPWNLIFF